MADTKISDLTALTGASVENADLFCIVDTSVTTTKKITVAEMLNVFQSASTTIPVNRGGTGQTSYTDGQLLIGNTTGNTLAKATLTAGSGISITNGAGSITIAATGGGGGTPGGSNTQVQFNNAGSFGGSNEFTWDGSLTRLLLGANAGNGRLFLGIADDADIEQISCVSHDNNTINWSLAFNEAGGILTLQRSGGAGETTALVMDAAGVTVSGTDPFRAANVFVAPAAGSPSVGTSGVGVLVFSNGTAPTSAPADEVQLFAVDYTAGDSRLRLLSESGAGLWLGNTTLEAVAPASGAGNSITVRASAAADGNTNGGDVLLRPGLKAGSGADGFVVVRQPGGTPGTDEIRLSHDGSQGIITSQDGSLYLRPSNGTGIRVVNGSSVSRLDGDNATLHVGGNSSTLLLEVTKSVLVSSNLVRAGSSTHYAWGSATAADGAASDTSVARAAAGVVRLSDGSTGPGGLSSAARTPTQITADQNNYSPGVGLFQRWASDASRNITGMVAGQDGALRYIWNVGSNNIVLQHENASSTAANRFTSTTGADLTLTANKVALCMYDTTSSRWRVTLLP